MGKKEFIATGRRKTAIALVRMKPGKGTITVNKKAIGEYFPLENQQRAVKAPLSTLELTEKYDIAISVKGGGIEGQASAGRLGIARALVKENETRQQELKKQGYLTRDPRKKERKKYGQPGARKKFQFSKR